MEGKGWYNTILWRTDPFLGSNQETNNETIFAARKWLGKHVPAATDMHATIEVVLETQFSMVVCAEEL
jgi:hypothetical protein